MTEPDFLSATRASYDTMAAAYAARFDAAPVAKPLDRAIHEGAFTERTPQAFVLARKPVTGPPVAQ